MQEILSELDKIKRLLEKLIGNVDLESTEPFNVKTLNTAAAMFKKMLVERGEWVHESDFQKYLSCGVHNTGKFIIREFNFTHYIKIGFELYYNKESLVLLASELKSRNINLKRYMEFLADKDKFEKTVKIAEERKLLKNKKKAFLVPKGVKNILTSAIPEPPLDIIQADIKQLKKQFFELKLSPYVDIYRDNHAMLKPIYLFEKYIDPSIMRASKKWCDDFNSAIRAYEIVAKKKAELVDPIREEDKFEL